MKQLFYHKNISYLLLIIFFCSFCYWIFVATKNKNQPTKAIIINQEKPTKIIFGIATVVDGDTIIINKNRIRLVGIDAPETKQKCLDKNYYEYLCGELSTNFLTQLINNKEVQCQYSQKDIYQRYLGICTFQNININHEMIKNGMAVIYNLKDTSDELKNLESEAQNKKIGIWQGAFQEPKQYRKTHRRK